jgi:hypothetical protein
MEVVERTDTSGLDHVVRIEHHLVVVPLQVELFSYFEPLRNGREAAEQPLFIVDPLNERKRASLSAVRH